MAANRQLGGIGNNLNQLTWHLNKDGAWPHPDTVQRLLDRVEASIADAGHRRRPDHRGAVSL